MKYKNLLITLAFIFISQQVDAQKEESSCSVNWTISLRKGLSNRIKELEKKLDTANFQDIYLFSFPISEKGERGKISSTANVSPILSEIFQMVLDSTIVQLKNGGCDTLLRVNRTYVIPVFLNYRMYKETSNDKKISAKELNYLNSIFQPPSDKKPNQNPAIPKDCIFFPFLNCRVTPYGTLFDTF